ncbi:MAG: PD-(D/E)XK nuclease family protein, partial [Bacteroidota bacterium]
ENKIYAVDQPKQLQRYHDQMVGNRGFASENIFIIYLTLYGSHPSEYTLGNLKYDENATDSNIFPIAYQNEIIDWLERCAEISVNQSLLRESIFQYINLVKELTGNTTIMEERQDIIDLLKEGNNIEHAFKIMQYWQGIYKEAEFLFWKSLEDQIKGAGYSILPIQKYSIAKIHNFHDRSRNKSNASYFGLVFQVAEIDQRDSLCIMIERGPSNPYYGFGILREEEGELNRVKAVLEEKFTPIAEAMKTEGNDSKRNGYWFEINSLENHISLANDKSLDAYKLINDEYRESIISEIWEEIQSYMDEKIETLRSDENGGPLISRAD